MDILLVGNSFVYVHDVNLKLAALIPGANVDTTLRGGSYLSDRLNPEDPLYTDLRDKLASKKYDYVVLQEQSNTAVTNPESYFHSVEVLSKMARENGAEPVIYSTWAYGKANPWFIEHNISYEDFYKTMVENTTEAARRNNCKIAYVGTAFYNTPDNDRLYCDDLKHQSDEGAALAAKTIAEVLK